MSGPRDRILEYALHVHYRPDMLRDLAPAILRDWERGVRGSSLEDLLPDELTFEPIVEAELELPRSRWRAASWFGLAALAAGVVVVFSWPREGPPVSDPSAKATLPGPPAPTSKSEAPIPESKSLGRQDPPTAEEIAATDALFRRMVWADVSKVPTMLEWERLRSDSYSAMATLAGDLLLRPPLWDAVEAGLRKTFELSTSDEDVRGVVLDLCARERSRRALDLVRDFWSQDPAAFGIEHMVAFAESGMYEFELELAAVLEDGLALPGQSRVLAAAFFALRGDDRGRAILEAGARSNEMSRDYLPLSFVAAAMLEELGEKGAWKGALEGLRPALEFLIGAGRNDMARHMVVSAEVFAQLRVEPGFPRLSDLAPWIQQRVGERMGELKEPEQIRAAAQRILDAQ